MLGSTKPALASSAADLQGAGRGREVVTVCCDLCGKQSIAIKLEEAGATIGCSLKIQVCVSKGMEPTRNIRPETSHVADGKDKNITPQNILPM
jgi:hypothetical protein